MNQGAADVWGVQKPEAPDTTATDTPDAAAQRLRERIWSVRLGSLLLAACLCLSGWYSVHEFQTWQRGRDVEASRRQALDVAKHAVLDLSTLDSSTIEKRMKSLVAMSSGEFRDQIVSNRAAQIASVRKAKVASSGHLDSAGVVVFGRRSATVAVALTATVSDTTHRKPQTNLYRVMVHLQRRSGTWVVDSLKFVQ